MKYLFLYFSAFSFAALAVEGNSFYQDQYRRLTLAMQFTSDEKIYTHDWEAPKGNYAVRQFFLKICAPEAENKKSISLENSGANEKLIFDCDELRDDESIQGWRFSGILDKENKLLSLEIDKVAAGDGRLYLSQGIKISLALGTSALLSSFYARTFYPNQHDKLLHVYAGGLISSSSMLISYYGLKFSKNNSLWFGFGLGVLAGIAKEYYDSRHADKHVKDKNDAYATFAGAIFGAAPLRLVFEFE